MFSYSNENNCGLQSVWLTLESSSLLKKLELLFTNIKLYI